MIERRLHDKLEEVASRERRLRLWCAVASGWAGAALLGWAVVVLQRESGWASSLSLPLVGIAGLAAVLFIVFRQGVSSPDWRKLACRIEGRHPELEGRLLTAVQQRPKEGEGYNFLQQRLMSEALRHSQTADWVELIPSSRLRWAQAAHWVALVLFGVTLLNLRTTSGHRLLARTPGAGGVTVTPGDAEVERGSTLVVLARFGGTLPPAVEMVVGETPAALRRISLVKSLADPMFGGSVPEVASNLVYHIEYGSQRTRDFHVKVFEHPRLERADADLAFPDYTGQPLKHIENTRRLSAVEGSRLDLALHLNKPVVSARLVQKDNEAKAISLSVETNRAAARLGDYVFQTNRIYELRLVDAEGRTNKVRSEFVFEVSKNRPPELRLASPRGDLRPSPLEEISFEGTVWDDFGVSAYGIGYAMAGQETKFVELGRSVPGKEKRSFQHLLRLEELGVEPDQLISWFVWADDIGPDGNARRTTGDLYFGEVRPFEEVFREAQGMDGQAQDASSQSGQGGDQPGRLAELQKQIISATWNLQRGQSGSGPKPAPERKARAPRGAGARSSISSRPLTAMRLSWSQFAGQMAPPAAPSARNRSAPASGRASGASGTAGAQSSYVDDAIVVRDSQAQALEQAEAARAEQQDQRAAPLWSAAVKEMQTALARLNEATNSPAALAEALAAEQAAYQAMLKLQEHEFQVARRNRNQRGAGSRNQQMQRQLEQMDLAQSEDRYETQREAQAPQNRQQREQLQVTSRLQDLARRQQDLNDRLKELQTALQEARTEQERAEIQRRLKRLEEEEQQMLADVDELRQRMDRPENQSQMAEQRRQLDQTREDVQRAADAAEQGAASQALSAGTRAQRQLQQLRDDLRKQNSSQFSDELRQMRNEARELAREHEALTRQMEAQAAGQRRALSDSAGHTNLFAQLTREKEQLTNLLDRAAQVSQQAEDSEPLLSRQLYDTARKFTQDTARDVQQSQEQLLERGLLSRNLYEELKDSPEPDGAKLLDLTSDLLRRDALPQAQATSQRAGASIDNFKAGVEHAAQSVIGDDTEALRLAQQELNQLTEQLGREITQAARETARSNQQFQAGGQTSGPGEAGTNGNIAASSNARPEQAASAGQPARSTAQNGERTQEGRDQPGENTSSPDLQSQAGQQAGGQQAGGQQAGGQQAGTAREAQTADSSEPGEPRSGNSSGAPEQSGQAQPRAGQNAGNRGTLRQLAAGGASAGANREASAAGDGGGGGDISGSLGWNLNRFVERDAAPAGPITGDDFVAWSDRLREVEEMVEQPDLRNQVADARERARLQRQAFRRDRQKPDWAVVQLQVMKPLTEVRDRIADELARRESKEALVPLDRDPVPSRYSELVRRYYEELGKNGARPEARTPKSENPTGAE